MELSIAALFDNGSSDDEEEYARYKRYGSSSNRQLANRLQTRNSKNPGVSLGDTHHSKTARLSGSLSGSANKPNTTDTTTEKWAKPRKKRQINSRSHSTRSPLSSRKKSLASRPLLPDTDVRRSPYEVSPAWEDFCEQVALLELKFQTQEHKLEVQGEKIKSAKRGTLDLPSSIAFSRILSDFSVRFENKPMLGANLGPELPRSKPSSAHSSVRFNFQAQSETDDFAIEYLEEVNTPSKIEARRRWHLVRIRVREMALEKRRSQSTFNWNVLRQHFNNMTNVQQARLELYDKYIRKPDDWIKYFKNELPESFHKLHESNLWRRKVRRPRTGIPVSLKVDTSEKKPRPFSSFM